MGFTPHRALTSEEMLARSVMLSCFRPLLHGYLLAHNPDEYKKWQGNCCRQTAIIGAFVLQKLLPDYKWSAWDGIFDDKIYGRQMTYDHAWIYGQGPDDKNLLVDIARTHKEEQLFIPVKTNSHPRGHHDYLDMVEKERRRIDLIASAQGNEYYTREPSMIIINAILASLKEVGALDY